MALCPHCDSPINQAHVTPVTLKARGQTAQGVSYDCPICMKILSIAVDPIIAENSLFARIRALLNGS